MKKKSLTEIRNALVVGNNSKSYNDKHPENPVMLRPIHAACKGEGIELIKKLKSLSNLSRPEIAKGIAYFVKQARS